MPLTGLALSARFAVQTKVITSTKVAALLEGSGQPRQTVLYSAHWDHLGIGAPDARGDTIYNGAIDNGTGLAALLELARAHGNGPRPQRSVVFLAWMVEEKGLLGSEYYAANPLYPLAQTAAMINMDALSPHGPARTFTISGNAKLDLLDQLVTMASRWNLAYVPDPKPEAGYFFRSDHFPLAKLGVPAISFKSGQDWIDGGVAAGDAWDATYRKSHYHQASDEWGAQWPFTGMARDLELLYALGRELAESSAWTNWAQDSEFRAVRDRSAARREQVAAGGSGRRQHAGRRQGRIRLPTRRPPTAFMYSTSASRCASVKPALP